MSAYLTNWAGNVRFHVEHVHQPASVEELQDVIAHQGRVRILGSAHSFNTLADTPGSLVSLAGLADELDVDGSTVTLNAGMRYGEAAAQLHEAGYALHNLGSLPHISVAGSCATATHGSGVANGNLATAVAALEIVTAGGELVRLDRQSPDFAGAVVNLGCLGAVTRMTLDVQPSFEVEQYVYEDLPHGALTSNFDAIMSGAYSVSLFTSWRTADIEQVWVKHRAGDPWTGGPTWFGARRADGPRHPIPGMSPVNCTEQMGVRGPWHERLPHFRLAFTPSSGEELQTEYFVPRARAVEALAAVGTIRDRVAPLVQISEIRTIASDRLWMSPCYDSDMVGIHFTWIKDAPAVLATLPVVEEVLAPFDPVPHWGKLFTMEPDTLQRRYPRLHDFRRLAHSFDPDGKFRNEFVDRYVFGR